MVIQITIERIRNRYVWNKRHKPLQRLWHFNNNIYVCCKISTQISVSWPTHNSFVSQIWVATYSFKNANTVCRIFMKFSTGVLNTKSCKREFREHRLDDSHTLHKGVNGFSPYCQYFMTDFSETGYIYPLNTVQQVAKVGVE